MVFKPAKLIRNIRKVSTVIDSTRFGLFLMCFTTAYKVVLCILRRIGQLDDRINAPVAGFFSGLTLAIDGGKRRELLSVLTLSRAIDSTVSLSESTGLVPKTQHRDIILWLGANVILQSAMGLKQGILNRSIYKFMATWS